MLDNMITVYLGAIVSVIGAIATVGGLIQQRKQSREDQKQRQEDQAHQQQEHELHTRQVDAQEQHNQELQKLYVQITETNDPVTRQQLETQYNEQLRKSNTLEARLIRRQNVLDKKINECRDATERLSNQIGSITTNNDLIKHGSTIRDLVDQAKSLIEQAARLKEQIDRQAEQGLNLDQFQREILRNIGQALQGLADQIASPTIRRTPPQEPPTLSTWGEG